MNISHNLILLAEIFNNKGAKLYLVGGFVRNTLLQIPTSDMDLASTLSAQEVEQALLGTQFKITRTILRLGTVIIETFDGSEVYEYTTFREDSYSKRNVSHSPVGVRFVDDIKIDAQRRDFKINAIYYDILRDEYVDPLSAILPDLALKTITTTRDADEVFSEDPLRILRLVRLACELNFEIEEKTKYAAKRLSYLLSSISVERKQAELKKILESHEKYPTIEKDLNKKSHVRGMELLFELNAMAYILPGVEKYSTMERYGDKANLKELTLKILNEADADIRLAVLMLNIGRVYCKDPKDIGHEVIAEKKVHDILGENGLKLSKREEMEVAILVKMAPFNRDNDAKLYTKKMFIMKYVDYIKKYFLLLEAIEKALDLGNVRSGSLKEIYEEMKNKNIPLKLRELSVNGNDCIEAGIEKTHIAKILKEIQRQVIMNYNLNTREAQMKIMCRLRDELKKEVEGE